MAAGFIIPTLARIGHALARNNNIYQSIGRGQAGRQAGALLFISIHFKQHSFPSCLRPVEHRYVSSDIYVLHMDALTIVSKQNNSGLAVAHIFENFLSYLIFATSE